MSPNVFVQSFVIWVTIIVLGNSVSLQSQEKTFPIRKLHQIVYESILESSIEILYFLNDIYDTIFVEGCHKKLIFFFCVCIFPFLFLKNFQK